MIRLIAILASLVLLSSCGEKGTGTFYQPEEPKPSLIVAGTFGDGIQDDTVAMQAALDATPAGGVLDLGTGKYLLSGSLSVNREISLLGYGAQFVATTKDNVINYRNTGGRIFGVEFIGANLSDLSGNGLAVQFYGDSLLTASPSIAIQNCRFSNFKGDYWVDIRNTNTSVPFDGINVSDNRFVSLPGNARNGASLAVPSAAISIQGSTAGALCQNVIVSRNQFDWGYSKQCVALWAGVRDAIVSDNIMRNVGADSSVGYDKGAYAILVYDSSFLNVPRRITISGNRISSVKSCGVYAAGAMDLLIDGNSIEGQSDPYGATLPKGGIVLNGCSAVSVTNNTIRNCVCDGIKSINDTTYPVRGLAVSGNTIASVDNGVWIVTAYGADRSVAVTDNLVTGSIRGISIQSVSPGVLSRLLVSGNVVHFSSFGVSCWSGDGSHLLASGSISNNSAFDCWMPIDAPSVPALTVSGNFP